MENPIPEELSPKPDEAGVSPTSVPAVPSESAIQKRQAQLLGALRLVNISNLSLDWQLADGRTKVAVEEANAQLEVDRSGKGTGVLHVRAVSWMEFVRCTELSAGLTLSDDVLGIRELQASCGSGSIRGSADVALTGSRRFNIQLNATNVDLEKMTVDLPSLRLSGNAEGNFRLEGPLLEDAGWTGIAQLQVKEGFFKGLSIFQMLGQLFQIQELANLKVRDAKLTAKIAGRQITLEEFLLQSPDIVLSAPGVLGFDRKLSINATLKLQERLLGSRLLQMIGNSFSAADAEGRRSIAFQVGGTLEKPSTNLMEKVVGEGLGGVINQVLGGLFKTRKSESKDQAAPK
jgi:hypothetical protein